MPNELLEIYLTDHCAAAAAGSRRMRRLADAERSAEDGSTLERIANEIEEDRTTLLSIMKAEGIEPRWYKSAVSRVAEAVGTLKTNGQLFHRSPLTSLVELEGMRMGVTGKLDLWAALQRTPLAERRDFDALIERASRQLHDLDEAHARRAAVLDGAPQPTS
jgi:hypothetical protein